MTCSFVRTDGIIPFAVGKDGRVYEKDLGKKTDRIAQAMKTYEPDGTWKLLGDRVPAPRTNSAG
jgi:Protein of unknown function (DUF2950)